ncbi:MAG: hypothetical protein ACLUSW_07175, partial [Faecalibacterium sp.]
MKIQIIQRQCGGTEFLPSRTACTSVHRTLPVWTSCCFQLPEAWAGCSVALYLRRSDGTLLAPVALDTQHR